MWCRIASANASAVWLFQSPIMPKSTACLNRCCSFLRSILNSMVMTISWFSVPGGQHGMPHHHSHIIEAWPKTAQEGASFRWRSASTPVVRGSKRCGGECCRCPREPHCRTELQQEVEILGEAGREGLLGELGPADGRGGGRHGPAEERRQRLHLVTGLDLLDVVYVGGVEELRAVARLTNVAGFVFIVSLCGVGCAPCDPSPTWRQGDYRRALKRQRDLRPHVIAFHGVLDINLR